MAFSQDYDYIETNITFGDSFQISFQVERDMGSNQNLDFLAAVVAVAF